MRKVVSAPQEHWLQKGVRMADQGLKMYGTAQGLYNAFQGIRGAYQAAAPMLALL